ncbi:hypothetical protein DSO57_1021474 [Entomophthora muscae]|uniref:Uncharacterized protein n=1 Tax=Entomophthora muscae TaxID=34485 RepID=A0ACC2UCU4_9FUNG|nr:hypothetical protein DSO57_1021474 [Entomophthora muscae]
MPANIRVVPPTIETETLVLSQCPEFYAEDTLILLQATYLRLFWLGSMWIWVMIPHVVNDAIHRVLISPLLGYFEDKSLSFAFALQNEAGSELENTIVQCPDPAQLTCPTHACGE